jgi:hypothetical protein
MGAWYNSAMAAALLQVVRPPAQGESMMQVVYETFHRHGAQDERIVLRFLCRNWDAGRHMQALQGVAFVVPGHRVFKPKML